MKILIEKVINMTGSIYFVVELELIHIYKTPSFISSSRNIHPVPWAGHEEIDLSLMTKNFRL
ncbi:MAG: hypothetical protein J6X82_06980 [Bacteroidales bacterium]|nr:hypothetical protein [Bacteroidales bacterium]